VKVIGWFVSAKRIRTRDKRDDNGEIVQEGRYMKFITMEDMTDVFDTVIFPNVYEKVAAQTLSMGPYCIEGIVDARYNTINVTRLALIENRLAIDDSSDRLTIEKQETYASQKAVQLPDGDIELLDVVPMEYEVEMAS
jgi:DNA polymerase III alpha subunit